MSGIVWADFSTGNMRVKATEHFLWHHRERHTVELTVNPGNLKCEFPEEDLLSLATLEARREFIAGKIRDLLATNENRAP